MKHKLLSFIAVIFSFAILSTSTNALSISAGRYELELSPGETHSSQITVKNREDEVIFVDLVPVPAIMNEKGRRLPLDPEEYPDAEILTNWMEVSPKSLEIKAGETQNVSITITVPEDIKPGAYHALLRFEKGAPDPEGTGVGVSTAIAKTIDVIIPGDMERNVEIIDFALDEESLATGDFIFKSTVKNTGGLPEMPTARIEIYDLEENQVKEIIRTVKEDGTAKTEDSIKVGFPSQYLFPNSEVEVETQWLNRNVRAGEYVAKLTGHWGPNQIPFSAETNISISESIDIIDFSSTKNWYTTLPAEFEGTVVNGGSRGVKYTAKLIIKNLFGVGVYEEDVTKDNGMLLGDTRVEFSTQDLTWEPNFAMGPYTAVLQLTYGENNNILEAGSTFFVMTWLQAVITIVVLLILIFLIYKAVKSYRNLKKKVEKIDTK